ncbi:MAG: Ig-like domain-containing protein [Deltaproteobacteria bacterium]|nr:Ig-like domain-containing protein [Deltaproteobacteria bacterium]
MQRGFSGKFRLLAVLLLCLLAASCSSSSSTGAANDDGDTTGITGNAVKGPISGALVQAFYFNDLGQLVELVAENAPVTTGANGGFTFLANAAQLAAINGPVILQTFGGTMYGAAAPILAAIIEDPSSLNGGNLASYLSTASTVAAELLKQLAESGAAPTREQAAAIIAQVEQELGVDLSENPLTPGTGVAYINEMLDQNLDLIQQALANNDSVNDYIDYLVANLSSASGKLDDMMDDPAHPGQDIAAAFAGYYTELAKILANPDAFRKLKAYPSSPFVSDNGVTPTNINALLVTGRAVPVVGGTINFLAIGAGGAITATAVTNENGIASFGLTADTQGLITIEASYALANGNTITSTTQVMVVADAALNAQTYEDVLNLLMMSLANCDGNMDAAAVMTDVCEAMGITEVNGANAAVIAANLWAKFIAGFPCGTIQRTGNTITFTFNGSQTCGGITGTVKVTPSVGPGGVEWTIVYQNLQKGEMVINGTAATSFAKNGNLLTVTHVSENLSANGYQLDGTSTVVIDLTTGLPKTGTLDTMLSFTYQNAPATADVDVLWDANLGFTGTIVVTMNNVQYNCQVTNVKIDPNCGIPTSGTMTINGFALDFSQTTCENQTVLIQLPVVGWVPIDMETAVDYFTDMEN